MFRLPRRLSCCSTPFVTSVLFHRQHYRGHVVDFMDATYRIGTLSPEDKAIVDESNENMNMYNAYKEDDPARHEDLIGCTYAPYCSESPMSIWTKSYFTPNELWYTRLFQASPFALQTIIITRNLLSSILCFGCVSGVNKE